jgi:hypothetical protein
MPNKILPLSADDEDPLTVELFSGGHDLWSGGASRTQEET